MSNFYHQAQNPISKKWEKAEYLDNYYDPHQYGVRFADGLIYPEAEVKAKPFNQPVGNPDNLKKDKIREERRQAREEGIRECVKLLTKERVFFYTENHVVVTPAEALQSLLTRKSND